MRKTINMRPRANPAPALACNGEYGRASDRGYVALLAVIAVAALLTTAVAGASLAGRQSAARESGAEAHAQARALADGCATLALTKLEIDASYAGDETETSPTGTCRVLPPQSDTPQPGTTTVKTQGVARGFYADVQVTVRTRQRCTPPSALARGMAIDSWIEMPSHE